MAFFIYLIGIADDVKCAFTGAALACLVCVWIAGFMGTVGKYEFDDEEEGKKKCFQVFKKAVNYGVFFLVVSCLIPNSKTLAAMYLVPKIAESKAVNDIGDKTLKILNGKLDQWVDEVSEEK